jgi:nitrogen regulatory protein PII
MPPPHFSERALGVTKLKRIEAVIAPWALDAFKEAAPQLGISEFDIVQLYRSSRTLGRQQFYRGAKFTADLPRLRLEFMLFDDKVRTTLQQLRELVHPESIAIVKLYQTSSPSSRHLKHLFPVKNESCSATHSDTLSKATATDRSKT